MNILKNILNLAISNIINFGTSFIVGFLLPMILTVEGYGNYKEYTLLMTFTYLFNFGFNDGIYIKYGGKTQSELNSNVVTSEHGFIIIFQLLILFMMLIYSVFNQSLFLLLFSIATFFSNMTRYYQNFLLAVGKFKFYSKTNIIKNALYICMLLLAIFLFKNTNYIIYIFIQIMSFIYLFVSYNYNFYKNFGFSKEINLNNKIEIFKVGLIVLIANMSLAFVGNVGNWIINWNYPIEDFAQYSFQNSILNVILLVVNSVGMVFYNIIAKQKDERLIAIIKNVSLYLGILSGLSFFVFSFIIYHYLPDYVESISLLSLTFVSVPYIMVSNILIANLYKATIISKIYLKHSLLYAVFSLILVFIFDYIFRDMLAVALATSLCYFLWYLYVTRFQFEDLKDKPSELLLLLSHSVVFLLTANYLSLAMGFIFYLVYIIFICYIVRKELKIIFNLFTT